MPDKHPVSESVNTAKEITVKPDGTKEIKTTTTTVTKYSDGSQTTATKVETVIEGSKRKKTTSTKNVTSTTAGSSDSSSSRNSLPQAGPPSKANAGITDAAFRDQALKTTNELRAKHGAPPLTIDPKLNEMAQAWANRLAAKHKMEHSSTEDYGENLYYTNRPDFDGSTAVNAWYSEIKDYNFKKAEPQKGCGHFTQVIWKSTTKFGIAKALDKSTGNIYVVANYDPPGNWIGRYAENISKAK